MDTEKMLTLALDIGCGMLESGAEIRRVENTVSRICNAYGAVYIEVAAISSLIIADARTPDGKRSVQLRRVKRVRNNLYLLELFNGISRQVCSSPPPLDELGEMISKGKSGRIYPLSLILAVAAITSAAFTVFFGGRLRDALFSSFVGVVIFYIDKISKIDISPLAKTALSAFCGATLACIISMLPFGVNAGSIMIGTVVMLVPGLAFGSALRNLLYGDLISGTVESVRAFLSALMIALGYAAALIIFRRAYYFQTEPPSIYIKAFSTLIGVIAFAIIFGVKPKHLISIAIGGVFTYSVYQIASTAMLSDFVCALSASVASAAVAEICARVERAPAIIFLLPCSTPILPGVSLYNAMTHLLAASNSTALSYFYDATEVGLGIACGVVAVSLTVTISTEMKRSFTRFCKKLSVLQKYRKNS